MSAFLGPIHIWLYNKIKFQDEMTSAVLDLAEENGRLELRSVAAGRYGELPEGNLEDLIDTGNIHGWLQEKVGVVENRLAFAVTAFAGDDGKKLDSVKEAIFRLGEKHPVEEGTTLKEAYDHLENTLLNGMPCDRVNELAENSPEKLVWRQTRDIHAPYWEENQGNPENYHMLRASLIEGMMKNSGIAFSRAGELYELKK